MSCTRPVCVTIIVLGLLCLGLLIGLIVAFKLVAKCEDSAGKRGITVADKADSTTQPPATTTGLQDNPDSKRISSEVYGDLEDGRNVTRYILRNKHMEVVVLNYGGIITQIRVPDKDGRLDDVLLGYDNLEDYERDPHLLGAIVGRYANKIAGATFSLDGDKYTLDGDRNTSGFSKRLWNSAIKDDTLVLTYASPDREDGFPGNVNATVTYDLTARNELIITYTATTSKATVINLTNRPFFNLAGHAAETVEDHSVRIDSDFFTPLDNTQVPTGKTLTVAGTMYDVRANTQLGPRLPQVPGGRGFDTNFALKRSGWDKHMASVSHAESGRTLHVYSTEPGLQFNTGYPVFPFTHHSA